MNRELTVYNLGNLPVAPLDDFHELQQDFKIGDPDKLSKLQMLILTRGFKYAFKAWKDPDGKLWIIDAHQRRKALLALRKAGFSIPDIPYEPIHAGSKKEAVEEIAAYNSEFARKNPDTLLFRKYQIDSATMERFQLPFEPVSFSWGEEKKSLFDSESSSGIREDESELFVPAADYAATLPGDVWLLGLHRLLCGDCRESAQVELLMNGRRADLCVTDPPYNVSYKGKTKDSLTIDNDAAGDDTFPLFLLQAFGYMYKVMLEGASIYVFHSDTEGLAFRTAFHQAGFKLAQCCVWEKNAFVIGRQDYQWQHEPVLYGWKPGAAHVWRSDRKQSTVWKFDKPQRNALHPTMKPVALAAYPVRNSSDPGNLVIDFFSGSGSTLMACQQTDRLCYAMEIDPRYVDATVYRYRNMFPRQQVRLLRDGFTFSAQETLKLLK